MWDRDVCGCKALQRPNEFLLAFHERGHSVRIEHALYGCTGRFEERATAIASRISSTASRVAASISPSRPHRNPSSEIGERVPLMQRPAVLIPSKDGEKNGLGRYRMESGTCSTTEPPSVAFPSAPHHHPRAIAQERLLTISGHTSPPACLS